MKTLGEDVTCVNHGVGWISSVFVEASGAMPANDDAAPGSR